MMKDNKKDRNELELKEQKKENDKEFLKLEIFIGLALSIVFLFLIFIAAYIEMEPILRVLIIICALVIFIAGVFSAIKIEQIAGYYECQKCHHRYIPSFKGVLLGMHMNRTRYMRCPKCNEKSWNKKVLTK